MNWTGLRSDIARLQPNRLPELSRVTTAAGVAHHGVNAELNVALDALNLAVALWLLPVLEPSALAGF